MKKASRFLSIALVFLLLLCFAAPAYASGTSPVMGEIIMYAFNFSPKYYADTAGATLAISTNTALFSILGTSFGGNGTTNFLLPDLTKNTPGYYSYYTQMRYSIALSGIYPDLDHGAPGILSEVRLFALNRSAGGDWVRCDGNPLPIAGNENLYTLMGTKFGGNGTTTFGVPDLSALEPDGLGYYLCVNGLTLDPDLYPILEKADDYLLMGQMLLLAGNYPNPKHVAACNGQLISIQTNTALFALLGTTYGGNGIQNYALPDTTGAGYGDIINPLPGLQYYVCTEGIFPSRN